MKKWLVAIAMLLASQASAATLSGPTTVEAGKSYWYSGSLADLAFDPAAYTTWRITLNVNGLDSQYVIDGVTGKTNRPSGFVFNYTFGTILPDAMWVTAILDRHVDGTWTTTGTFNYVDPYANAKVTPGKTTVSTTVQFDPLYLNGAKPPAPFEQTQLRTQLLGDGAVTSAAAVMPLGGALPMLVTALAALGWVARSRAKAETVAA
jgi:hypothetical protein